ncbi:proline-rich domain-containing protein [Kitasatospora sp. NPDC004669]|uniref:proline-rich domain-containing protein n=1 Tax=Kitasatospora sp. NPDC004669 TaxID=3154555 RepID=UPI0033A56EB6
MSYPPDPNNPYGQPPAAPGYGYPQQAPPAPGYGYPQQAPPVAPGYGYAPAVPQSMPGLVMTTRVLLFIVGGAQVLLALAFLIGAAVANDAVNKSGASSDDFISSIGHAAAGIAVVIGIVWALAATLSITLGAKFGRGGNGVRITTIVYASIASLFGLIDLVGGISQKVTVNIVFGLIWVAICVIWITAMCVRDGVNWFNRPRY